MEEKKLDLRIEKTYLALRTAFTALLEEKYFEDITINELCQRAMIRRTTFYKHFADKYEYFRFYIQEISDDIHKRLPDNVMTWEPDRYLVFMCKALLEFLGEHESIVRNVTRSSMLPILTDTLSEYIASDALKLFYRTGLDQAHTKAELEGLAEFYAGGLVTMLRRYLLSGTHPDEEQFLHVLSSVLHI